MKFSFHIMVLPDDGVYSPETIRDLLKQAEAQGHPLGPDSYLREMKIRQIDALVHGRTDA
jgi:hypothetical protein